MTEATAAADGSQAFLLTIHSHGLGIMGLYGRLEDAQEAALRDALAGEMESAVEEHGPSSPGAMNVQVSLAWKAHSSPAGETYQAEFDHGAMSHYYEILPRTVGEDLDGF